MLGFGKKENETEKNEISTDIKENETEKKEANTDVKESNTKEDKKKKKKVSSFENAVDITKTIFRKRDIKFEKREFTKEDKKAIIYTILVMVGIGLLLWFLPFTHQFMVDFVTLKF